MDLPGYDAWKTMSPYDADPRCEFCGAYPYECGAGWQPRRCTGECGAVWRDPDAEYEAKRDDPESFWMQDDY